MKKQNKNTKRKANYRDYEIKFWKDWLEADMLKRLNMIEKLPLFKMCLDMKDTKMWREAFAQLINGYFEDLRDACDVEHSKETIRKKG